MTGGAGAAAPGFGPVLEGRPARLVRHDGHPLDLAAERWLAPAGDGDHWFLDRCTGPVLDLGCGPGRLVAALVARGVPAVGVDVSPTAQRLCRARGAPMLLLDLYGPLPAGWAGRPWAQVILADGNIGIGGDPRRLLRRAGQLLGPRGTALVETDPDPRLSWRGTVRVHTADGAGAPMPWACVGAEALVDLARAGGWRPVALHAGARSFVALRRG